MKLQPGSDFLSYRLDQSYSQPNPYHRRDGYAQRGYYWRDEHCRHCGRVTAWTPAGRADSSAYACMDCGSEASLVR